jgi:hypothetical protein
MKGKERISSPSSFFFLNWERRKKKRKRNEKFLSFNMKEKRKKK